MNVYFISASSPDYPTVWIKVGKAASVRDRLSGMQTGCPLKLKLLGTIECNSDALAIAVEAKLHRILDWKRTSGEWFYAPALYEREVERIIAHEQRQIDKLPDDDEPQEPESTSLWLSEEELIGLTGKKQHALQVEILNSMKPPPVFWLRHDDQFALVARWQFETDDA